MNQIVYESHPAMDLTYTTTDSFMRTYLLESNDHDHYIHKQIDL